MTGEAGRETDDPFPRPVGLTRSDLSDGLRELVAALTPSAEPVSLRLIGGAAISLVYDADRRTTADIDGQFAPRAAVLAVSREIGARHGWPEDWLNDAAVTFLPTGFGTREHEWDAVFDDGHVVVEVGSASMLLAMKLYAAQRRGAREFTPSTARIVQDAFDSGYEGRKSSFPDLS